MEDRGRSVTLTAYAALAAFPPLATPLLAVDLEDSIAGAEIRQLADLMRVRTRLRLH